MSTQVKPCNFPCVKCGSTDIHRRFRIKGEKWSRVHEERKRSNDFVTCSTWEVEAHKDCLTHHCRCCQFDWETPTLSQSAVALAKNDEPSHDQLPARMRSSKLRNDP